MKLPTAVYTAHRGYAWSNIPQGLTAENLDSFSRMIADARGDFPDPLAVDTGIVSDGRIAAAFTTQNVGNWDANGRSADYGAFVFFPAAVGRMIDFTALISNDFFWTPSRTPPDYIDYTGAASEPMPQQAPDTLRRENFYVLSSPKSVGSLLAACGSLNRRWVCLMQSDGTLRIECDPFEDGVKR